MLKWVTDRFRRSDFPTTPLGSELRNYGSITDHNKAHGLDSAGLRASISEFLE